MIGDEFISRLRGQEKRRRQQARADKEDGREADGAEDPGDIEAPAGEEAVIVIVEVCLKPPTPVSETPKDPPISFRNHPVYARGLLTIILKLAPNSTATTACNPVNTFHPLSRFCLPPAMMTMYAIVVIPSITTAKLIRKPTERHMLQKYRSCAQSTGCGKGEHVWVREEHRRWRP